MEKDTHSIQSDYQTAKAEHTSVQTDSLFYVRPLGPTDAEEFRKVRLEAISKTNLFISLFSGKLDVPPALVEAEQPLSVWEELLTPSNSANYFGVFDGECIIAIGKCYSDSGAPSGRTLGLGAGYVLDAYRRNGVITLLFNGMVEWAKQHNYEHIVCQCRMDNEPIKAFLKKNGFVQTGTEIGIMCSGEVVEGFRMERPLDISRPTSTNTMSGRKGPSPSPQ